MTKSLEKPNRDPRALPPHPVLGHHYTDERQRRQTLSHLFDSSASDYDRISAVMSFGTDKAYRRKALQRVGLADGMMALDVACGTGVLAAEAATIVGAGGTVVGLDRSEGMLGEAIARQRLRFGVQGDAQHLPFPDHCFDVLSMGYALRHVADLRQTFADYSRVLRPGGRLLILEITPPDSKASFALFKLYLKHLVPLLTRAITFNSEAQTLMSYFWDSVEQCVAPATILAALEQVGFAEVDRRVTAGVFSEYTATKKG